MYSEAEWKQIRAMRARRLGIITIPAAVAFLAAVSLFVYGQINRNDWLWLVTVTITLVGGCAYLFLLGLYVRPVCQYEKHVEYMLHGRKHETTGILKLFDQSLSDKNGVDCHRVMLNVGLKDDGEDDRLFYFDAHKEWPNISLGQRVTIISNDMMVAEIQAE